jgi:hypothetical protein
LVSGDSTLIVRSGSPAGSWSRPSEIAARYRQVRAITRAEQTEDETALLRVARGHTVRQIEQDVRQLRSSRSADLDTANLGRAKRHVTYFYDEIGSLHFFGRLPRRPGRRLR